ncbi:MAG: carboxypeptidase M32, partial [Hyphomicrobiales bacterium]
MTISCMEITSVTVTPYRALEQRFRRINAVEEAADLLSWDQATMMPEGGRAARAEELAALHLHAHELLTASETGELLAGAEENGFFDWDGANLREMRRKHAHATALPADLVDAMSRASVACEAAWRQARRDDDFGVVAPLLEDVVMLARRAAEAKSERLGVPPYEALMDQFEPGARTEQIDLIFADYIAFLPDFLARVLERQNREPAPVVPSGPFPIVAQKELARQLAQQLGFTFDRGRLDESPHPFSTGRAGDVRITTRYRESEAMQAVMA